MKHDLALVVLSVHKLEKLRALKKKLLEINTEESWQ